MNNLFILGNGFDLAHGLKTSYLDFVKYIIKKCIEKDDNSNSIMKIGGLPYDYDSFINDIKSDRISVIRPNYTSLMMKELLKDVTLNNWCDIEHKYFELLSSIKKESTVHYYQSVQDLNRDFELIKKELENYLVMQQPTNCIDSYKRIFNSLAHRNSLIINFNYTDTIQQLYSDVIKSEIIHIHGKLKDQKSPIIFGYAANDDDNSSLINKNENEYLKNIKRFAYNRTDTEHKLKTYLNKTKNIYVNILGHSIGLSDKLILEQILNHDNIKFIRVFYYENYENYFNTQINLYRIMKSNSNFDKLINYANSIRMPQINDTTEQLQEAKDLMIKIQEDYKRTIPYIPGIITS